MNTSSNNTLKMLLHTLSNKNQENSEIIPNLLNKSPIFVNGFSRGGTNILMNLLLSHPETAIPTGELQEVIHGGGGKEGIINKYRKKIFYKLPLSYLLGKHYFELNNTTDRKLPSKAVIKYIDFILYTQKVKATRDEGQNLYISPGVKYTKNQVKNARLVCKNMNGLIYLNQTLNRMYSETKFICIIRDGLALLEGHMRRGWSAEKFTNLFNKVGNEMISYRNKFPNYMIIKYEDIVSSPFESMMRIYDFAGLDPQSVKKVRLQVKKTVNANGEVEKLGNQKKGTVLWYDLENMGKHFIKDTNLNQIRKLSKNEISEFIKKNRDILRELGYNY